MAVGVAPTRLRRWLRRFGLAGTSLALIAGIAVLSAEVMKNLDALRTANTDDTRWSLSQLEVEFMLLDQTVIEARQTPDGSLTPLRKRFDLFYSRAAEVLFGPQYRPALTGPQGRESVQRIEVFLDRMAGLVDGPDAGLRRALPDIERQMTALRPEVRTLALKGVSLFAQRADARRASLAGTLLRLAAVALALIILLLVMVFVLARLNRLNRRRMVENQQTRTRLEVILETTLDAVLVTDAEGRIIDCNGTAGDMFSCPITAILRRGLIDFVFPTAEMAQADERLRRYGESGLPAALGRGRARLQARRADGAVFPVELSLSGAHDQSGEIYVAFLHDISAQLQADQELRAARDRALAGERAKAQFLAVMSHEMRTPLNGLLGTLDLLEKSPLTAKQEDYVQVMKSSGRLLLDHINDVLDISKAESDLTTPKSVRFDLSELLQEVVDAVRGVAEAGGNAISLHLPPGAPVAMLGDPSRLRQVMLNLVGNALKFTEKGQVDVAVTRLPANGKDDGGRIEIRVTDTGIGIEPDDLARIFDDFVTLDASYRRNAEGTGLGLGIARRLVKAMGGEMGVESWPLVGSSFWLRLPLGAGARARGGTGGTGGARAVSQAPSEAEVPADRPRAPQGPLDVLVVEDNKINRFVVREMLASLGHRVTEAADGREGTRLANAHRFDVILMDVSMPVMDGLAATRAIRAARAASAAAPIIALTAHARPEEHERFFDAGMTDCLTKPVTSDSLRQALAGTPGAALSSSAPEEDGSVIDLTRLEEMRAQVGAEGLAGLLDEFLAEGDGFAGHMLDAALDEALAEQAHKVKGSASVFGAVALREVLAEVEDTARFGDEDEMEPLRSQVAGVWAATRSELVRRVLPE